MFTDHRSTFVDKLFVYERAETRALRTTDTTGISPNQVIMTLFLFIQKQERTVSTQVGKKDEVSSSTKDSSHASSIRDSSYLDETNVNSVEVEHPFDEKSLKPRRKRNKKKPGQPEHNLEVNNPIHQVWSLLLMM